MRTEIGPADDLFGGVAVQLLGASIPARDRAVEILADDGVLGRFDDRRQPQSYFLFTLLFGDVPGEAAGMNEVAALPQHAGVDDHVLDRTILAPHSGLAVPHLLAGPQPLQDVLDHVLIGVELGDVMADVLLGGVAEQIQLRPVRPEDGSIRSNPVQPDGGVVEEIG